MLDEHAGYLLLVDEENAVWLAAPFLEHLNTTTPDTAPPAGRPRRTGRCRGPGALDALLRLARAGALTPAGGRSLLPHITAPARPEAPSGRGGFARRLAARWARPPAAARDKDWVLVAETLLTDAVDAEHTRHLTLEAVLKRAHSAQEAMEAGPVPEPGAEHAAAVADLEVEETIVRQNADRLPGHDIAGLLRELTATVHPAAGGGSAFRWARVVRGTVAGLLRRGVEATAPTARQLVFDVDLDEVRLGNPAACTGPHRLGPRRSGCRGWFSLAERLRAWSGSPRPTRTCTPASPPLTHPAPRAPAPLRTRALPPMASSPSTRRDENGGVVGPAGGGHGAAAGRPPDSGGRPTGLPRAHYLPARARRRPSARWGGVQLAPAAAEVE